MLELLLFFLKLLLSFGVHLTFEQELFDAFGVVEKVVDVSVDLNGEFLDCIKRQLFVGFGVVQLDQRIVVSLQPLLKVTDRKAHN